MENEKRKVGDYTVLCAVNNGSREIILAENEQDMAVPMCRRIAMCRSRPTIL